MTPAIGAWVVGSLLASAAGSSGGALTLTSGWPSVLDLEAVQSVTSDDVAVVTVAALDQRQVVLLGAVPGVATITVSTGAPGAGHRTEYRVTVVREATLLHWDGLVKAHVGRRSRLRIPSVTRVVVGDASMCEAVLEGSDALVLVPRRPGMTSMLVWTGGTSSAHRRRLLVVVESGGVVHVVDDFDAVLIEPFDGRLVLVTGEHAILDVPGATRFAVTDEAVAQVRINLGGALVVEGRSAGATRVLVWTTKAVPEVRFVVVLQRARWEPLPDDPPAGDGPLLAQPLEPGEDR